jgi:hypothetical protein
VALSSTVRRLRPPLSRLWARADDSPHALPLLIALTVGAASGLAAATGGGWEHAVGRPTTTVAFCALAIGLHFVAVDVYGRGSISFGGTGLLAVGFAVGPAPAIASAVACAVLRLVVRRGRFYRALFDAGQLAIAAGFGTLVFDGLRVAGAVGPLGVAAAFAAGLTFLTLNIGLLTAAMAFDESASPLAVWSERFKWITLYGLSSGPIALALLVAYDRDGTLGLVVFALAPLSMMFSLREYVRHTESSVEQLREKNLELARLTDALKRTHRDTVAALSRSVEAKDLYTGGHVERVATVSVELGRRLGFGGDDLEAIEIGALLHDIGKLGMPESILNKPGPLDDAEWVVMRRHPLISETILSEVELHPFVRQIARSSHERIDGKGYPDGLSGEDIPLAARIVLVADAFDALTTTRSYRAARGVMAAVEEIRANSGSQFCPRVVAALDAILREAPELLRGEGNEEQPAAA